MTEGYTPTSDEEAKAAGMMSADERAESAVRSEEYESLTPEDRELLGQINLKFNPDGFTGDIKGHKVEAGKIGPAPYGDQSDRYYASLDGKELSIEDAKKIYEKYMKFKFLQNINSYTWGEYKEKVSEKKSIDALNDIL